jgi:hypothetical protein
MTAEATCGGRDVVNMSYEDIANLTEEEVMALSPFKALIYLQACRSVDEEQAWSAMHAEQTADSEHVDAAVLPVPVDALAAELHVGTPELPSLSSLPALQVPTAVPFPHPTQAHDLVTASGGTHTEADYVGDDGPSFLGALMTAEATRGGRDVVNMSYEDIANLTEEEVMALSPFKALIYLQACRSVDEERAWSVLHEEQTADEGSRMALTCQ